MDSKQPHPNYRLFIVIIAILAIGVWLTAVSLYKQKQQREEIPVVQITPAEFREKQEQTKVTSTKGLMLAKINNASVKVGGTVVFTPSFNSDGKDVVGYDLLVDYEDDAFTYNGATSLTPSFSIVPVVKDGLISITGYKPPEVKTETVFKDSQVVKLTFTAKKKGRYTIAVLPTSGKQTSKFVDSKLGKSYPRTSSIEISVE